MDPGKPTHILGSHAEYSVPLHFIYLHMLILYSMYTDEWKPEFTHLYVSWDRTAGANGKLVPEADGKPVRANDKLVLGADGKSARADDRLVRADCKVIVEVLGLSADLGWASASKLVLAESSSDSSFC